MLILGQTYLSPSLSGNDAPPMRVRLLATYDNGTTAHVRVLDEGEWKDWTCTLASYMLARLQ